MTFPEFDQYLASILGDVQSNISTKGREYANSKSRFANFDRLAIRLSLTNTQVGLVYLTKHMDAIESYIANKRTYSTETIQGRIADAVAYLLLIGGMIAESSNSTPQPGPSPPLPEE